MQVTACEKESSKEFLLTGCHFFCWHVKILGVTTFRQQGMIKLPEQGRRVAYGSNREEYQKGAFGKRVYPGAAGAEIKCDAKYDF